MITKNTNNQNISAEFIENLRNGFPLTPKLLVDGVELECVIDGLAVEKGSVSSDTFELGAVVGDIFTAKLRDVDIELKGKQLEYQLGILVDDEYEFISLGKFKVTEAKRSRQIVNVTAYSSVISNTGDKFNTDSLITYSISELRTAIQVQTGNRIVCDSTIDTSVVLEKFPIQPTIYQVLQLIALVCGGYVINDNEGTILIKQFSHEPNLIVDGTLMTSLPEIDENAFLISSVGCEIIDNNESDEESRVDYIAYIKDYLTNETGEIFVDEQNNEFEVVTQTNIDNAILKISSEYMTKELFTKNWTNILGYEYSPANIFLAIGDPRLEACDVLNVIDVDDSEHIVPCHRINHTYNGAFTSQITAANTTLEDMSIGTALPISSRLDNIEKTAATVQVVENAIEYATELIRGGLGGYVVMTPGENGYPQEILIMDTPDIATAQHVWRFNQGGLGHSSNGYEGPFDDIALTQDGKINASMITTGIINANLIKAGILQDENENVSLNLATGLLRITKGIINLGNGNFIATDQGRLTSKGGGLIQDIEGTNYWDLTNGVFSTTKGKIAQFNISNYAIYKETSSSRLSIAESFKFVAGASGGIFRGFILTQYGLDFYIANDLDSWPATRVAEINSLRSTSGGEGLWFTINDVTKMAIIDEIGVQVRTNFSVSGTKSRIAETDNYSDRLLYCYETPTPLFGDIGEATIDEDGLAFVEIDDIFSETVADRVEYQVFLQAEGEGTCYIAEKTPRYFLIKGTPNLKVAWELKAKQKDYEMTRLEMSENGLEEYSTAYPDELLDVDAYINEMEGLLYG